MAAIRLTALSPQEARFVRASEYYWGNQYRNLKPWDADGVPLYEKAPRVRVRLTRKAVDTANNYLFGAHRRPKFRATRDLSDLKRAVDDALEQAREASARQARDPESAGREFEAAAKQYGEARAAFETARAELAADNAAIDRLAEQVELAEHLREIGRLGLLHGACAVGFHQHTDEETGETFYDLEFLNGAGSKPIYGRDDKARARMEGVRYSELLEIDERWRSQKTDAKTNQTRHFLHRRRWTTTETIEYYPIEITRVFRAGDLPDWVRNEEATAAHGLGFVPAEWFPNGRVAGEYEGVPLVDESEFTLEDQVNYTLSQTGRGVHYNQDPRTVFIDADNLSGEPIRIGADNSISLQSSPMSDGHQAQLKMLELAGTGQETAMKYAQRVKELFFEMSHIVLHDPEKAGGVLSGTALERLLEPMLAMCLGLRLTYGGRLARLMVKLFRASTGRPIQIVAVWPPIVTPTVEDREVAVRTDTAALDANLIDERTATESIAHYYSIEDVDAYLEAKDADMARAGTGFADTTAQIDQVLANLAR